MSFKTLITEFNNLSEKKFNYFFKCIKLDKSIVLNSSYAEISDKELQLFIELRDKVISLLEEVSDEQNILEKLVNLGLDNDFAKALYKYCLNNLKPIKDAEFINSLSSEKFEKIINFVFSKFVLYNDYDQYFSNYAVSSLELNNSRELKIVLRFLYYHTKLVSSRIISPEMLKLKLEREYDVPIEINNIFIKYINNNIHEMQNAYLLSQINVVESKMESINDFFKNLNKSDSNKEGF